MIGSIAANVVGGIMQNQNKNEQYAEQQRENQRNREHNFNLAAYQNSENRKQWARENQYNLPENQMARMKAAGLNPDLMYGNGSVSANVAARSPEMTGGSPSNPSDASPLGQRQTIGDIAANTIAQSLATAQIEKTKAEAKNTSQNTENMVVEGKILAADALTRAAQNEQIIEIGKSQVYVNHSVANLNHATQERVSAEITELAARTESMYQTIDESKARIKNLNAQTASARYGMYMRSKEFKLAVEKFQQVVKESNSNINLNYTQAADYLATRAGRVLNLNVDASFKSAQISTEYAKRQESYARTGMYSSLEGLIDIQSEQASFNLDSDKSFKNIERGVHVAKETVSIITDITNAASNFVSGTGFGKLNDPSRPQFGRSWK